jgi:hypothetical protein
LLENLLFLVFKMKIFLCPEAQVVGAEAENLVIHSPLLVSGRALQRLRAKHVTCTKAESGGSLLGAAIAS